MNILSPIGQKMSFIRGMFDGNHSVYRKDKTLDILATRYNVAQFVSFSPSENGVLQQYNRLSGRTPNDPFPNPEDAIEAIFARSTDNMVNIRSFAEGDFRSREFIYGIKSVHEVMLAIKRMASEGVFTIVNETVDVSDGGVSGVAMGGVVEFRPDATPRGVEQAGFAVLPAHWATSIFKTVYGTSVDLAAGATGRLEFSVHPRPRGWKQEHTLYWEYEDTPALDRVAEVTWPNDFSRMLGDKVFGLLIADLVGVPVPKTTVINRRIAPFAFGSDTTSAEVWIRTSPSEQMPGLYTTARGWLDPFKLLLKEDPTNTNVASVLSQQNAKPQWSGAAIESLSDGLMIEGVEGAGDDFMLGKTMPQRLPKEVMQSVADTHRKLHAALGPVRFEWVYDGSHVWVVQLHRGTTAGGGSIIVPGDPKVWLDFHVADGLEALRRLITSLPEGAGLRLDARIGLTSHLADLVRKAQIPTIVGPLA